MTISNGDIVFDSKSLRLMKDEKAKVSIYNSKIYANNASAITERISGICEENVQNSTYISVNASSTYRMGFDARTRFLGSNSLLRFNKFTSKAPSITSQDENIITPTSGRTVTINLYCTSNTSTPLHTLTTSKSPTSDITLDLTPFNDYVDLIANPGEYYIMVDISGNIKFNNPASYGNVVITSKCTLD
jgi:hypothetical protein